MPPQCGIILKALSLFALALPVDAVRGYGGTPVHIERSTWLIEEEKQEARFYSPAEYSQEER